MIGSAKNVSPVLDYTGVSAPFSIDDVQHDMNDLREDYGTFPEQIRMWEHQWNWLIKDVDNRGHLVLWGIPVKIEDPAPVEQLFAEPAMSDEEADEIRRRFKGLAASTYTQYLRAQQEKIVARAKAKC